MVIAVRHDEAGALSRPARRDHQDMRGVRVADDGSVHLSENEAAPPGQAPLCGVQQRTELRVAFVLCRILNSGPKMARPEQHGFPTKGREIAIGELRSE